MKTSCLRLRNREPEKPSEGGGAACAAPAESTSCLTDDYVRRMFLFSVLMCCNVVLLCVTKTRFMPTIPSLICCISQFHML